MHILFVKSVISAITYSFDVGIASLSSVLKKHGHTVDLFIFRDWKDTKTLTYRIKETKPDVIAFSVYESGFKSTVKISSFLRKRFPDTLQIMGGIHIILNPDDIDKTPTIDAVCTGEGEYVLIDLLKRYKRKDNSYIYTPGFWFRYKKRIIKNPTIPFIYDIDALPIPDRSLFANQAVAHDYFKNKPKLEYLFTRGCPFDCTYCSNHALKKAFNQKQYLRRMSPERAIAWIKNDLKYYACDDLIFHDDTFTLDKNWVNKFTSLYKKDIQIPYESCLRVGTFEKSTLLKMKRSGCKLVLIGVESGDERFRLDIMKRDMKNDAIIKAFTLAKEVNLQTLAFVMLGLPEETPESFIKTVKLIGKISPDLYILSIFHPYKGTYLYQYAKSKKYIDENQKWNFKERTDTILKMPQFPRIDILYYYNHFHKLLYHLKKTNSHLSSIHKHYKFKLLSVPPSSKYFTATQLLYKIDDIVSFGVNSIMNRNVSYPHY